MISVDREEIRQLAARSYPEYGISGKIAWVEERNQMWIGISGHKAQHADLTVELGFSSDMGVANSRYPHEVCEGQSQDNGSGTAWISTKEMADVEFYLQSLGVPARRNVWDSTVQTGEKLFYEAKCHLCHTPTLHTSQNPPQLMDGTVMKALAGQTFHPYTDYLLHDLGPELGDDFSQYNATGDEWRTAPLWGIGLQEIVSGHSMFLHDSRARNLIEAIMWHEGEGDVSRKLFERMSRNQRNALISFLRSL
jgi:Predicted thiol oxidoreductase